MVKREDHLRNLLAKNEPEFASTSENAVSFLNKLRKDCHYRITKRRADSVIHECELHFKKDRNVPPLSFVGTGKRAKVSYYLG